MGPTQTYQAIYEQNLRRPVRKKKFEAGSVRDVRRERSEPLDSHLSASAALRVDELLARQQRDRRRGLWLMAVLIAGVVLALCLGL